MDPTHCAVDTCITTILNRPVGVHFYRFPKNPERRNKWMKVLKNRCTTIDLMESRICSKHFELKYFDSQRRLKENAIPTLFAAPTVKKSSLMKTELNSPKTKVDRLLLKLTQAELTASIKRSLGSIREPSNLDNYVTEDLQCKHGATTEAQLWLIIKKQQHLNNRLMHLVVQTKKHVEILENNMAEFNTVKKEQENKVESLKYVVKCLQEKQATLEEQVEILTTVEART